MLELRNLACGYGLVTVVEDLNLAVPDGGITALLGPNGAGKTSTIMGVAGHVEVKAGDIVLDGQSILGLSPSERTQRGIGLVPEGRRVFPDLTVAENLLVGGYVRARAQAAANEERVLALFPRLRERYRQRAGTLSGGEQQMLAIGRGLMAEPSLLILDEPSLGLSPLLVEELFALIKRIHADGTAVLLVEQNVVQSLDVAQRAYVLDNGTFVLQGPAADIRNDPDLKRAYLGF